MSLKTWNGDNRAAGVIAELRQGGSSLLAAETPSCIPEPGAEEGDR